MPRIEKASLMYHMKVCVSPSNAPWDEWLPCISLLRVQNQLQEDLLLGVHLTSFDTSRYEANETDRATREVLLLEPPNLYCDGMFIHPPLRLHDMLTQEGLPHSSQVMIIHMCDLKAPHLERAKPVGYIRLHAPQVGSDQYYANFVRPISVVSP
jgi:hypothetical protein